MNKAILIDPYESGDDFVREVEYNDFRDIQSLIGCRCFTTVPMLRDTGFCDDEGLLTLTPDTRFLYPEGLYQQPIAGRILVVGPADEEGNSGPPTMGVEFYRNATKALSLAQVRRMFY